MLCEFARSFPLLVAKLLERDQVMWRQVILFWRQVTGFLSLTPDNR
jgi:hypothetical protein